MDASTHPDASGAHGHVHVYSGEGVCLTAGCSRLRPDWLNPSPDADADSGPHLGPNWTQRALLVMLSLVVAFGCLHYVGAYVTRVTERPSQSNGYLDLPDEVGTPAPTR